MIVETICFLFHKGKAELGIKTSDIEAKVSFDTQSIEQVHEWAEESEYEVSKEKCIVIFKSGNSTLVGKSYKEMIRLWQQ